MTGGSGMILGRHVIQIRWFNCLSALSLVGLILLLSMMGSGAWSVGRYWMSINGNDLGIGNDLPDTEPAWQLDSHYAYARHPGFTHETWNEPGLSSGWSVRIDWWIPFVPHGALPLLRS